MSSFVVSDMDTSCRDDEDKGKISNFNQTKMFPVKKTTWIQHNMTSFCSLNKFISLFFGNARHKVKSWIWSLLLLRFHLTFTWADLGIQVPYTWTDRPSHTLCDRVNTCTVSAIKYLSTFCHKAAVSCTDEQQERFSPAEAPSTNCSLEQAWMRSSLGCSLGVFCSFFWLGGWFYCMLFLAPFSCQGWQIHQKRKEKKKRNNNHNDTRWQLCGALLMGTNKIDPFKLPLQKPGWMLVQKNLFVFQNEKKTSDKQTTCLEQRCISLFSTFPIAFACSPPALLSHRFPPPHSIWKHQLCSHTVFICVLLWLRVFSPWKLQSSWALRKETS